MPLYALLGATGSTGSAILRCLLLQPPKDLTLNLFVRSISKLYKMFPALQDSTAFEHNIIEGVPSDSGLTQRCLKDVDVVMLCIASNYSSQGMTISYDTATAVVDALKFHRKAQGSAYVTPTLIQLRSASLNQTLKAGQPWMARTMASFCFRYCYEDLDRACTLFTSCVTDSPGLLNWISVDPPSIHDADGTTPTGYRLMLDGEQEQQQALSYADLGVAFCELAQRRDEFAGKEIGVTATGTVNMTIWPLAVYVASGAKGRIWG